MINNNYEFDQTIFNPGNEPSFGTPYLYNFVGRQDLSVLRSRFVAKTYYHPTPDGLPGNSDAGAMESWLLWNMIGMYPLTGQTTFLIGSPWFEELTIHLGEGKELKITSTGGSDTSFYVQSLKVNGEPWDKSWVTWDDVFADGGTLDFELGPEPKDWATGPLPPTPASDRTMATRTPQRGRAADMAATIIIAVSVIATGTVIYLMLRMRGRKRRAGEAAYTSMELAPGVGYVGNQYESSGSDLEDADDSKTARWRQ